MGSSVLESLVSGRIVIANMKPEISRKQAAAPIGDSDDFVLPVAPPLSPLGNAPNTKRTGNTAPGPSSSSNAADDAPSLPSEPPPLPKPLPKPIAKDSSEDLKMPAVLQDSDASGISAPWSLVVILACVVIGLVFVITNRSNDATANETSAAPSSEIDEHELISAQREAKILKINTTKMEGRISELEQQLVAERLDANAKFTTLLSAKKNSENNGSDLLAEVDRLKRQLQSSALKDPPPAASRQLEPMDSNYNGTPYRVTGLRPGDTLNVRSGPGVNYSIVTALQNGAKVTGTGAAVMNGPDEWLPCIIAQDNVDPATGYHRSSLQKCWINSYFIERAGN